MRGSRMRVDSVISDDSSDDEDGGTAVDVSEVRGVSANQIPTMMVGRLRAAAASDTNWTGTSVFEEEGGISECTTTAIEELTGPEARNTRAVKSENQAAAAALKSQRDGPTASVSQRPRTKIAQDSEILRKTTRSRETAHSEIPLYTPPARRQLSHHNGRPTAVITPSPEQKGPSVYYPDPIRPNWPTECRQAPRRKRGEAKGEPKEEMSKALVKAVQALVKAESLQELEQKSMASAREAQATVETESHQKLGQPPSQSNRGRSGKADKESAVSACDSVPVQEKCIQTAKQPPDPGINGKNESEPLFKESFPVDANVKGNKPTGATPTEKQKRQKSKPVPAEIVPGMSSTEKANTRCGKEKIEISIQTNRVSLGVKVGELVHEQHHANVPDPPRSTLCFPKFAKVTTSSNNSVPNPSSMRNEAISSSPAPPLESLISDLASQRSPTLSTHTPHSLSQKTLSLLPSTIEPRGYFAQPASLPFLSHAPVPAVISTFPEILDDEAFSKQFEEVRLARQKVSTYV